MFRISNDPFGYKCDWLAIKSDSVEAVISFMKEQLGDDSDGQATEVDPMILTESKEGWVLVRGAMPGAVVDYDRLKELNSKSSDYEELCSLLKDNSLVALGPQFVLSDFSSQFGEACYFSSYRVSDSYGWSKFVDGKLARAFHSEGDYGIILNEGDVTPEEKTLPIRYEISSDNFPSGVTEDQVIQIAKQWTCDPTKE